MADFSNTPNKINNKLFVVRLVCKQLTPLFYLFGNALSVQTIIGAKRTVVAKCTPSNANFSVAVMARKTRIHRYFLHSFRKISTHKSRIGKVGCGFHTTKVTILSKMPKKQINLLKKLGN